MAIRAAPVADADVAVHVARIARLANLLDTAFRVPGTRLRFGLDGLLGLVPGVGDALTFTVAAGIVGYAAALGVRRRALYRMAANVGADFVIGSIPLLGDIFDFAFKANRRNLDLLRAELRAGRLGG